MEDRTVSSLGAFSVSLSVKDLQASLTFYQALGFETVGGDEEQNWLILRNGSVTVGLFQGMFEKNLLTFNPGWDARSQPLTAFEDVREIQQRLRGQGVTFASEVDEKGHGPGSLVLVDPDGNQILVDQHV